MGKHAGNPDPDEQIKGPHGDGPHPTPSESERAGREFDRSWDLSQKGWNK